MDTKLPPTREKKNVRMIIRETLGYIVTAVVIVVPIRLWIAQPFIVNGASMDSTFRDGEYLIVDELSYRFESPSRGDVVVFKYPLNPKKYFIKRVIGLPGETVRVKNDVVTIINADNPSGFVIFEPYVHSRTVGDVITVLGEGEYFVMGDNRIVSLDSRSWGALPKESILGTPFVRLLPFSRIDYRPGMLVEDPRP